MTVSPLQGITHACFGLSYLLALGLELARRGRPSRGLRIGSLIAGAAGLFAHTTFIAYHRPTPAEPYGAFLYLAWVLALFYFIGSIQKDARQAWAVFALPVVIALVGLSLLLASGTETSVPVWVGGDRFWGIVHGVLILGASIGVSIGFLASVMYLVQTRRIKNRVKGMNRSAVNWSFPLLTAGLLVGTLLLRTESAENLLSVKVLSTAGLWVVFLVLLYLRYATSVPARRLAALSIIAFGLLLIALIASHPFLAGGNSG
jgi:ABC-type uncharacterized transport system permease subunit